MFFTVTSRVLYRATGGLRGLDEPLSIPICKFNFQTKSYSIDKFVKVFGNKLPRVVKIVDGFESPDGGKFTFGAEEVR